ncbi:hypothetical protein [Flagellimonas sp. 2504JD1-5]
MRKVIFYAGIFFLVLMVSNSCKARPEIGDDLNACRKNCNTGSLDGDTACLDRCNCYHTHDQKLTKCNDEYDETISTD